MTPEQFAVLLRMDFRPTDLGDSEDQFAARLDHIVTSALARPNTSQPQQEAGARYLLLSAQLRQMVRETEEFEAVGEIKIKQGLSIRMAELRAQRDEQLMLSSLQASAWPQQGSVSIPLETCF